MDSVIKVPEYADDDLWSGISTLHPLASAMASQLIRLRVEEFIKLQNI